MPPLCWTHTNLTNRIINPMPISVIAALDDMVVVEAMHYLQTKIRLGITLNDSAWIEGVDYTDDDGDENFPIQDVINSERTR